MKNIKITPLLIFFLLLEIILLFLSIYYLFIDNNGGMALAGSIAIIGFVIILVLFAIERIIVQNIKSKKSIWYIESLLILLLFLYIWKNGFSIG